MRNNKVYAAVLLAFVAITTGCKEEHREPVDPLESMGLLGNWRLQSVTINGITDMIVYYDTLELTTGLVSDDLIGEFRSVGVGYQTNGQFEINEVHDSIFFFYNNTQKAHPFRVLENSMTFTYFKNSNEFSEDWSKLE